MLLCNLPKEIIFEIAKKDIDVFMNMKLLNKKIKEILSTGYLLKINEDIPRRIFIRKKEKHINFWIVHPKRNFLAMNEYQSFIENEKIEIFEKLILKDNKKYLIILNYEKNLIKLYDLLINKGVNVTRLNRWIPNISENKVILILSSFILSREILVVDEILVSPNLTVRYKSEDKHKLIFIKGTKEKETFISNYNKRNILIKYDLNEINMIEESF